MHHNALLRKTHLTEIQKFGRNCEILGWANDNHFSGRLTVHVHPVRKSQQSPTNPSKSQQIPRNSKILIMTTSQEDSGYTSRQGAGAANSLPAPMIAYRSVMLLFVCKNGIWLKLKKYLFEVKKKYLFESPKSICLKAQKVFDCSQPASPPAPGERRE